MKIIVIGAVAAGTSAAAKARRNDDNAQITMYEKDMFISYSGCGMPYYIGDEIDSVDSLTPRDPAFFKKKYNVDVHIGHEVIKVDSEKKEVLVRNLLTEEEFIDTYDKLILATGARAAKPPVEGIEKSNVFFLRNINDVKSIKGFIELNQPKTAVVVGSGFIGFEVLENLMKSGVDVTMLELAAKITPNLDADMAAYLETQLKKKGLKILTNCSVSAVGDKEVVLSNGESLEADMVLFSTGVRPNVELAEQIGIELGITGAIKVNQSMETSVADIYACGDCIETFSVITGKPVYRPLGSTANKTGRIAGDTATGGTLKYQGNLGTGIFKILDLAVSSTGLNEKEAVAEGYEVEVCHNIKPDKPDYMGGKEMLIKAVAEKNTGRLLGVQIVGGPGVDKRTDVFATLITYKATVDELFHLDLAYAPPFSTTKDPVHYTGMILDNAIHGGRPLIRSKELQKLGDEVQIIDARSNADYEKKGCVEHAVNMPHGKLRAQMESLNKEVPTVTYCNKGVTGNAAQNILLGNGFKEVYNLSGGHRFYKEGKKSES